MKGYTARTNEMGFRAIRLHYTADPAKDPQNPDPDRAEAARQWLEDMRRVFPDPNQFQQEFELNWWASAGTRVYPEFSEDLHTAVLDGWRDRKTIYRAWDFGWHAPACLVAQVDSKERLVILKEIVGREQTTRDFAKHVVEQCAHWFGAHVPGYTDYCDPAGQQARSTATERSEVRDVEVLNAVGVYPNWAYGWSRKDGRALVHQLLVLRTDGTPGLYVVPDGCPVLMQGFLGKYVYAPRRNGQVHDEPDESNHPWADVHACLRYLATGLYNVLGLRRPGAVPTPEPTRDYHGYGVPRRRT